MATYYRIEYIERSGYTEKIKHEITEKEYMFIGLNNE